MKTKVNGVPVSTRIPQEDKDALVKICDKHNMFPSEFIRVAILESIAGFKARKKAKKVKVNENEK